MGTTPRGGVDEGVHNLERFIGILMNSIEQVQAHTTAIENHGSTIDDLDHEAEGALQDLGGALDDLEETIESGEEDAVKEIGRLGDEAQEGSDQRLAESESSVEGAESSFESAMQEGRSGLEQELSSLTSDGFTQLESTMDNVESGLADDRQQAETAFDGLDTAVQDFEQRGGQAFDAAEAAFDQTNGEIANHQSAIETDAGDGATAFDALGDDIDGHCRGLAGQLEGLCDGWKTEITDDATDLVDQVTTLFADTGTALQTAAQDQLDTPAQAVLTDAFEPYLSELAELQALIEGAQGPASDELLPLVDDLEKALGVIETIDQLLNALE